MAARKPSLTELPEFAVRADVIIGFTKPKISRSTFHELVNKNRIVPVNDLRGYYLLNASLKLLGLNPTRKLPEPAASPGLEDIVRLAFTLIDRDIFPPPSWLLHVEAIDLKDADHARHLAEHYRNKIEAMDHVTLKLAYFQGALDAVSMGEELGQ